MDLDPFFLLQDTGCEKIVNLVWQRPDPDSTTEKEKKKRIRILPKKNKQDFTIKSSNFQKYCMYIWSSHLKKMWDPDPTSQKYPDPVNTAV